MGELRRAPGVHLFIVKKLIRSRGARFLLAVLVLTVVGLLARPHVRRAAAAAIDRSPNHGLPAPAASAGELRVEIASPPASLAMELVDVAPGTTPRGTVFVLHGIRDQKESMRGFGAMLANSGFRAILIDLRGHGRSTGEWLSYGAVESHDMVQVLDALTARGLVVGKVGALGISYGAATSIEWAGVDPRVQAVVAIAPFASLRAVVPGYAPVRLPGSFVDSCIDEAGREADFDPDRASPVTAITHTRASVLLIHGRMDDRIPPWHSEHIAAAGADHAELILLPGETHETIGEDRSGTIRERGMGWFAAHL
jgi:dipeptidyl aminopeptidase/acylaminoacyl peptidase